MDQLLPSHVSKLIKFIIRLQLPPDKLQEVSLAHALLLVTGRASLQGAPHSASNWNGGGEES